MTKQEGYHKVTRLVRGRAATYDHSPVEISEPRFVFTDAEARDDLYAIPRRDSANDSGSRVAPNSKPVQPSSSVANASKTKVKNAPLPLLDAAAALRYQHQAQLGIGMAIGSPRQSPWTQGSLPPPKSGLSAFSPSPHAFSSVPYSPVVTPEPRDDGSKQKAKWKVLGGLFGKKTGPGHSGSTEPFPKLHTEQLSEQVQTAQPTRQNFPPESRHQRHGSRSLDLHRPSPAPSPYLNAPTVRNGGTQAPEMLKFASPLPELSPRPPPKDKPKTATATATARPREPVKTLPMLQVNIPDTKMERYSVMFDNVLNPRNSTLLMRRQAQLERLKLREAAAISEEVLSDNDNTLEPPNRRATLPSPAKSPSYSLFPNKNRGPSPKPGSSATIGPLQRSATAPTLSPLNPGHPNPNLDKAIVTPQIVIEEDSSPVPDSPETPKELNWQTAEISPVHPRTSSLGENDADPRQLSTTSIVIHLAEESPEAGWKRIPAPREGTIELAGTPVYHTPVLSPIPKRPAQLSPHPVLNKPLPSLSAEPDETPDEPKQALLYERSRHAEESLVPSPQAPALESPRPPRKDSHRPPPRPARSQSYDSWTPQDLSQRVTQPKKSRDSRLRRPSNPPQELSVPSPPQPQVHSPLTDFHLRSPRKASLPVTPSQPLEHRRLRKTSLALQPTQSPSDQRSPPKSFPMLNPPAPLVAQADVPPATPPKSSPPVPIKSASKDLPSKDKPVKENTLRNAKSTSVLQSSALVNHETAPIRHEKKLSLRGSDAQGDWPKPASAIAQWPGVDTRAPVATISKAQRRPSDSEAERRSSQSTSERPQSLQRKPVGSAAEHHPIVQAAERRGVERRPSAPVLQTQQPSRSVAKRRPSVSVADRRPSAPVPERRPSTTALMQPMRPGVARASTERPHPLKSAPATAAEISIARQISISRRQQMMVPIVPKTARQPQQATLVKEGEPASGAPRHVPRKSQHALLETA